MNLLHSERWGALLPSLVLAAVGVVVLSALSTAAIVGWLPAAHSVAPVLDERAEPVERESLGERARSDGSAPGGERASTERRATPAAACADCATVVSVRAVAPSSSTSGLGAVAGGVVGGLLGNQIGGGTDRTLATVAGAGGGAYVGDRIERDLNRQVRYRVTVRTDDGDTRTVEEATDRWKPGDRVRVTDGRLVELRASR